MIKQWTQESSNKKTYQGYELGMSHGKASTFLILTNENIVNRFLNSKEQRHNREMIKDLMDIYKSLQVNVNGFDFWVPRLEEGNSYVIDFSWCNGVVGISNMIRKGEEYLSGMRRGKLWNENFINMVAATESPMNQLDNSLCHGLCGFLYACFRLGVPNVCEYRLWERNNLFSRYKGKKTDNKGFLSGRVGQILVAMSLLEKKKRNIDFSIMNYLSRSCFRAAPFGLFASVGSMSLQTCQQSMKKWDNHTVQYKKYAKISEVWLQKYTEKLIVHPPFFKRISVRCNKKILDEGAYYIVVGLESGADFDAKRIRKTRSLELVVQLTQTFINVDRLKNKIILEIGGEETDVLEYLKALYKNNFLLTSLDCSIPTKNHAAEICAFLQQIKPSCQEYRLFRQLLDHIDEYNHSSTGSFNEMEKVYKSMDMLLPHVPNAVHIDLYDSRNIRLPQNVEKDLLKIYEVLSAFSIKCDNPILTRIIEYFNANYNENDEIPLMEFLYNSRSLQSLQLDDYALEIQDEISKKRIDFLLSLVDKAVKNGEQFVELPMEKINSLTNFRKNYFNAWYFALVCNIYSSDSTRKYNYVLNLHLTGARTPSLMGRFYEGTYAEELLKSYAHDLKTVTNPEYIFAEISEYSMRKPEANNLGTSQVIHAYEITIGTQSKAHELMLSDLVVGVDKDELYLKSSTLNKIIIPIQENMIFSGSVYSRIGRFLSILSSQYLPTNQVAFSNLLDRRVLIVKTYVTH